MNDESSRAKRRHAAVGVRRTLFRWETTLRVAALAGLAVALGVAFWVDDLAALSDPAGSHYQWFGLLLWSIPRIALGIDPASAQATLTARVYLGVVVLSLVSYACMILVQRRTAP